MALDKDALRDAIIGAFQIARSSDANPAGTANDLAQRIADAIDDYIKAADVIYIPSSINDSHGDTHTATGSIANLQ